ncbi:MAG: orotidine 5'-phosphate decarboxylase / HUMPS family protein [Candidatus Bipolaricaulia bacterium]
MIPVERSLIPACDVPTLEVLERIVRATHPLEGIGGYKVGFELGLRYGLPQVVAAIRSFTDKPILYDHQKAGTDVPFTGERFAQVCRQAGVDAVILFPQAGPETQAHWIAAVQHVGLTPIVGGWMTHHRYTVSEGGYLEDGAPLRIYLEAARHSVREFVVPGNRPEIAREIRGRLEQSIKDPIFYAPGLIVQGGAIEAMTEALGRRWHAIIGRAITEAREPEAAARELIDKIAGER